MATNKKQLRSVYGLAHTRFYTKSVISDYLVNTSDDGVVEISSDVNLLLRQKTLHRKIGIEALRDYVDTLRVTQSDVPSYTDDELFQLIEPKAVNNLTTCYEYAKYLQSHQDEVKQRHESLKSRKKALDDERAFYDLLTKKE